MMAEDLFLLAFSRGRLSDDCCDHVDVELVMRSGQLLSCDVTARHRQSGDVFNVHFWRLPFLVFLRVLSEVLLEIGVNWGPVPARFHTVRLPRSLVRLTCGEDRSVGRYQVRPLGAHAFLRRLILILSKCSHIQLTACRRLRPIFSGKPPAASVTFYSLPARCRAALLPQKICFAVSLQLTAARYFSLSGEFSVAKRQGSVK